MEMEEGDISNKRKKTCHDDDDHINISFEDDDEDDDEEKKIQKFFSIIRSIREARDHILTNGSEEENKRKKMKKKVDEEEKAVAVAVWNPSFRPEDFAADDDKLIKYAPMAINFVDSSAKNAETAGKEEDIVIKEGLDLKLSL